jgi:hypothetical protein
MKTNSSSAKMIIKPCATDVKKTPKLINIKNKHPMQVENQPQLPYYTPPTAIPQNHMSWTQNPVSEVLCTLSRFCHPPTAVIVMKIFQHAHEQNRKQRQGCVEIRNLTPIKLRHW